MTDCPLLDWTPPAPERAFDGETYQPEHDHARLTGQLLRVYEILQDRGWHSLRGLASRVGGSEASVSARLRDLRKPKYGSHNIQRKRLDGGLYLYRMGEGE